MSYRQEIIKRIFDFALAFVGLLFFWWLILLLWILTTVDTRRNGFFIQKRVGQNGELFKIIKLRTMREDQKYNSHITYSRDPRITRLGYILRKLKLDELPQLWNILIGKMSFVGPRPDLPGYADRLQGEDRVILHLKPGLTGPATLYFLNEEELLTHTTNLKKYNDEVIWPKKVALNKWYFQNQSLQKDIKFLFMSIFRIKYSDGVME